VDLTPYLKKLVRVKWIDPTSNVIDGLPKGFPSIARGETVGKVECIEHDVVTLVWQAMFGPESVEVDKAGIMSIPTALIYAVDVLRYESADVFLEFERVA
jgi:hypothetical protein